MVVFADTNWLEAIYVEAHPDDKRALGRVAVVQRRMRRSPGAITVSPLVLMEARNVFSRISKKSNPDEWADLASDFGSGILVDAMNWDQLMQETNRLIAAFAHKGTVGTFDLAIVASANLAGAREILSFDERLKAIAVATGIKVFPPLEDEGRSFLMKLKSP